MNKLFTLSFLSIVAISYAGNVSAYGSNVNYYNADGTSAGYSSKGYNGNVNYYNADGTNAGYASKGYNGTVNYYNADGTSAGYSR